jgi:hypothetical protein
MLQQKSVQPSLHLAPPLHWLGTTAPYALPGRRMYTVGAATKAVPTMAARRKKPRREVRVSRARLAAATRRVLIEM